MNKQELKTLISDNNYAGGLKIIFNNIIDLIPDQPKPNYPILPFKMVRYNNDLSLPFGNKQDLYWSTNRYLMSIPGESNLIPVTLSDPVTKPEIGKFYVAWDCTEFDDIEKSDVQLFISETRAIWINTQNELCYTNYDPEITYYPIILVEE